MPAQTAKPVLSVVVLCYRAEDHAGTVIMPLYEELEASGVPYELVLVANAWAGSGDTTPAVVAELARDRPAMSVVSFDKGGDMGWDMRTGLQAARGDYLVVIDGDGQVPTRYALDIYKELERTGADIVKGRRYLREDGTARTLSSIIFNLLFVVVFGTRALWDINGRPKGFRRDAWERLDLRTDDWFTDAEIVLKARQLGLRIRELPVVFLANPARPSFVNLGTFWEFLRNMALWRLGRHPAMFGARGSAVSPPGRESAG
jgi:glycosyltransferase involved in cell wall biosynthesis